MERPNIEEITKKAKRGAKYRWMQETILSLCEWIKRLEIVIKAHEVEAKMLDDYQDRLVPALKKRIDELEAEIDNG